MIDFKGLLLSICFVTALGLNTTSNEDKQIGHNVNFTEGFSCHHICKNKYNITGRTAKCHIKEGKNVHVTLVRNQGPGVWLFYAVDNINFEEDRLCEKIVNGNGFLKNHLNTTICPFSIKNAENYAILDLKQKEQVKEPSTNTSNKDDNGNVKTLINELDGAVNKVLQKTGVTTMRFAQVGKKAKAAAEKVVETMNHLKKEVGLVGNDTSSTAIPPDYLHGLKENREKPLDGGKVFSQKIKVISKRSNDGNSKRARNEAAELISVLVNIVKNLLYAADTARPVPPPYNPNDFSDPYEPLDFDDGDWFTRHLVSKTRNEELPENKKGFLHVAPPTSPPYNPPGVKDQQYNPSIKRKESYALPPTFPPYNPTDLKQKHKPNVVNKEDDWSTLPSISKIKDNDSSNNKKRLSHIAPPTPPPYNPTDVKDRRKPNKVDKEDDWPTLSSVLKQRGGDSSRSNNKEMYYIPPPTFPPNVLNGFKTIGNSPVQSHSVKTRGDIKNSTNSLLPLTPSIKKTTGGNDKNNFIRDIRLRLEELKDQYKRSGNLKKIVENLDKEISKVENIKKETAAPLESAYPLVLSPIVDAVVKSVGDVNKSSQTSEETGKSLRVQYRVLDYDDMLALCGVMITRLCEKRKLLHCKNNDKCCWAYIDPSACSESNYDGFKECYTGISNLLDTLKIK